MLSRSHTADSPTFGGLESHVVDQSATPWRASSPRRAKSARVGAPESSRDVVPGVLRGKMPRMTMAFRLADLVVKHLLREGELPCA